MEKRSQIFKSVSTVETVLRYSYAYVLQKQLDKRLNDKHRKTKLKTIF